MSLDDFLHILAMDCPTKAHEITQGFPNAFQPNGCGYFIAGTEGASVLGIHSYRGALPGLLNHIKIQCVELSIGGAC